MKKVDNQVNTFVTRVDDLQCEWTFVDNRTILLNGKEVNAVIEKVAESEISLLLDGKFYHIILTESATGYIALINGEAYQVEIVNPLLNKFEEIVGQASSLQHPDEIRAPMPGLVVKREVKEGENVKAGQGIVILEAMKMENEVKSPKTGIVQKLFVQDHQIVEKGEVLALIL